MTRVILETDKYQIVYGNYHCTLNFVRRSDEKAVRVATGRNFVKEGIMKLLEKDNSQINEYISGFMSFDNPDLKSQTIKGFNS